MTLKSLITLSLTVSCAGQQGITDDQARLQMAAWAIWAAPLILGNDVRALTAEQRAILLNAEVIAIDQDPAGAAGPPMLLETLPRTQTSIVLQPPCRSKVQVSSPVPPSQLRNSLPLYFAGMLCTPVCLQYHTCCCSQQDGT